MRTNLIALLLTLALPLPTLAENIIASNPEALADYMRQIGYRAELTTDDEGDPKIKSATGGANFSIYFYGCEQNKGCDSLQLSSGFDLDNGSSLNAVNSWNSKKRYGKAYLDDEKDPYIEYDVNLAKGGVSQENFRDTLEVWDRVLTDFRSYIDF